VGVGRLLARHGVLVKTTGDGILARFTAPAQAVRCAASMIASAIDYGLESRAGLHAGEVLVTGTVRDLVVGSGFVFDDR
jgi:class 3 adenylate cyclase